MKKHVVVMFSALIFSACGGGGPKQAEGPKPNLDDTNGGGGTSTANDKAVAPEIEEAQAALENKDCVTATAKAKAFLDKTPDSADGHFVLGVCLEQDGKKEEAAKEYDAALKSDPHHVAAAINDSALLIDMGKFDEAEAVCKVALAKAKGQVELHINLAYALKGKGDHAGAAKSFANAITLKPDAGLMVERAGELLASGDKDGAAKTYKNVTAKSTDSAVLADAAIGLATLGDAPGCVAAFDKAIATKSTSTLLMQRAICKHKAGDLAGARKDLDDALADDPKNLNAQIAAAKYAEEASDKKACKMHYSEVAKLAKGELQEQAKKGEARCSK